MTSRCRPKDPSALADLLLDNARTALWLACLGGVFSAEDAERIDVELKRAARVPPRLPEPERVDHGSSTRH